MIRLLISLLILLAIPSSIITQAQNSTPSASLFYTFPSTTGEHIVHLCALNIHATDAENCFELPLFFGQAFSPDYAFLAIRESTNGQIHLVDLAEQSVTSFGLCQPLQEFLWDEYSQQSGVPIWSPDGRFLALTGVETTESCSLDDDGGIYLYDVIEQDLSLLTANIAHDGAFVTPASWSPDSEWLMLYGAWSDNEADSSQRFRSAMIARDGSQFREIAPHWGTCRLQWSPNMQWLASDTACVESLGTGSDLMIIPFDLNRLADSRFVNYIDETVPPLQFGHRPLTGWQTSYSPPIWITDEQIVSHRRLIPLGPYMSILSTEEQARYHFSGLVSIDLKTMSETLLMELPPAVKKGDWFITEEDNTLMLVNARNHQQRTFSAEQAPCLSRYSVQPTTQGDYIAVLNNCTLESETATLTIYGIDGLVWERVFDTRQVRLLGFSG